MMNQMQMNQMQMMMMMQQMGRTPSQKQVNQMMKAMNKQL